MNHAERRRHGVRLGIALLKPSEYESDLGELVGRDPRDLSPMDFQAAGVALLPAPKAIRAHCIDCCGGEVGEVRKCIAVHCHLWPMRMGFYPADLRAAASARTVQPSRENTP
jgi:hypothetical protein